MSFLDTVRLALNTIRVQKVKSSFTVLGVMIGVMFLIAVISVVQGMSDYVENDFAAKIIGVNTFTLHRRASFTASTTDAQRREQSRRPRIYPSEVGLIRTVVPAGSRSAIVNETFAIASSRYATPRKVDAVATESDYFTIKKLSVAHGRAFVPQEVISGARVMVIGTEVADHFFNGLDPVGRDMRIGSTSYTVIGVIETQGSVFGFSLDRLAIAPLTTPLNRVIQPLGDVQALVVQAPSPELVGDGIQHAREVLRSARRLPPGKADNFTLETSDSALEFFASLKEKMLLFGTALPFIGLFVSALVIMNIMLVAVAERTREIGIRKALGARRRDIMSQFLVEAATLSLSGAAIGIALGIAAARVVSALSPLPAAVAPWSIGAALLLGAGVGVAAGTYPASRAAKLDPIEALRQE